jgi:hypothetical protein
MEFLEEPPIKREKRKPPMKEVIEKYFVSFLYIGV